MMLPSPCCGYGVVSVMLCVVFLEMHPKNEPLAASGPTRIWEALVRPGGFFGRKAFSVLTLLVHPDIWRLLKTVVLCRIPSVPDSHSCFSVALGFFQVQSCLFV
ncbi:hypothetical protein ILYODFUR_014878 [Ilyodon furcidens]|uniref:Secreted protein n=1 Tax=Ilyodon furcidens TaxID=33524 RepID=A0ABV0V6P3_9TELE